MEPSVVKTDATVRAYRLDVQMALCFVRTLQVGAQWQAALPTPDMIRMPIVSLALYSLLTYIRTGSRYLPVGTRVTAYKFEDRYERLLHALSWWDETEWAQLIEDLDVLAIALSDYLESTEAQAT